MMDNTLSSDGGRLVERVVKAHRQREGGGFIVRRPIGGEVSIVDPFLLLDHFGPTVYGPGEAVGAPDHPHRGFETVSYILSGGIHHQDSCGNEGNLQPGWVQWMTAGAGVVHSEMPTDDFLQNGGVLEGFQLWVNLSSQNKFLPPRYQDTPPEKLPVVDEGDVWVKIIAGSYKGTNATIETQSPIFYLDVRLSNNASMQYDTPSSFKVIVYCFRGAGIVGANSMSLQEGSMAMLGAGETVSLKADGAEFKCLLLGGEPLNEPVARYGPFVMNTREEIQQAFADFHAGKLGSISGEEERMRKTREARDAQQRNGRWNPAV